MTSGRLVSVSWFVLVGSFVACSSSDGATNGALNTPPPLGTSGSGAVVSATGGAGSSSVGIVGTAGLGSAGTFSGGSAGIGVGLAGSGAIGTPPAAGSGGMSDGTAGTVAADGGTPDASSTAGASGSGNAGAGGSVASGNCGTRTGMRGKTSRTVTVGGTKRTFIAYLPMSASPTTALPFVYVFHGASQTGQQLYDMTEYSKLADTENIAVVFPDGQGVSSATNAGSLTPWNVTDGGALCGLGTLVSNPNAVDFAFMDAMKADMEMDQCLDDQHTFATGFSMGGYFTHHIACDRTDIRAAGPHSGGTLADLSSCKTAHVPMIIFHGTSDPLINEACDDPTATPQSGFPASGTLWAKKNGCKDTYQTIPTNGTSGNGQCYLYDGCPTDGQVEVCTFTGMEHAWAGAPTCQNCIGSGAGWASATQLEWAFYKKYAW
jgi:polyhydroxybutyrate depolymerase